MIHLLKNHMIHLLKKDFSKNVFNKRRITLSKTSSSSFSDCSSSFKPLDVVLSILETIKFNLSENA